MNIVIAGIIKFLELEGWYSALTPEQQQKLKEYSGQGEGLIQGDIFSSQTQKHFFWTTAGNAVHKKDYDFTIFLAEKGLTAQGSLVDQHFVFNSLITAYERKNDHENAKKHCLAELKDFSRISRALRKDFDGELPSSIPCRDSLLDIVAGIEQNYEEAEQLIQIFVQKSLLTPEEAKDELKNLRINKLHTNAEVLLTEGKLEQARSILEQVITLDESQAAEIYKTLANCFLKNRMEQDALRYFQKAFAVDPLIGGVRTKLERLSKELGVQGEPSKTKILNTLAEKRKMATEWWAKRDLANEYVKIKHYDDAWTLFNEALLLRSKAGMPCGTIYPHMARLLERENRYEDAIFHYLLSYKELISAGSSDPPKYVSQGLNRCLKKLELTRLDNTGLYELVRREKEAARIQRSLEELIKVQRSFG